MEFSRPRILEWVAFPFSRESSQPRDQTQVSCIAGGFFNQLSHKGRPPSEEECSKKQLSHLYRTVLLGLCLPLVNYLVSFSTLDLPWDLPQHACTTSFQDGFQPRGLRDQLLASHIMGWCPLLLTTKEPFRTCEMLPLSQG